MYTKQQLLLYRNQHTIERSILDQLRQLKICKRIYRPTKRGKRGGARTKIVSNSCHGSLRTMTINFQSMLPKKVELWHMIETMKPDIIFGTETWLRPEIENSEILPPECGYNVFRKDRHDGYGGVMIAVKNYLIAQELDIATNSEAIFVKVRCKHSDLTLGTIYRTSSPSSTEQTNQMTDITNCLNNLNKNNVLWIGGDLNLPDIDWKTQRITGHQYPITMNNKFLDTVQDLALTQTNEIPTRGNNILDLFFTNRPNLITKSTTIPGLSDHDIILTDNKLKANKISQTPRIVTIWKKADINAIKKETDTFTKKFLTQPHTPPNVEQMWTSISDHINTIMKKHIPTKTISKKFHQPWINTKLKRLSRQKQRAWAKAKASNSPTHWERYKILKKETRYENRKAFQMHVKDLVTEDSNKNLWKFIKSEKCYPVGIAPLNDGDKLAVNDIEKANTLNKQFCSVFVTETSTDIPPPVKPMYPVMPDIIVTKEGVEKLLLSLNPQKAAGPDGIPSRLLQLIAKEIAPALTTLFQTSLDTSEVPSTWKHAIVQPIFKKGDRSKASNYRPISLTCICCKLIEHIVRTSITKHLDSNNILSDVQHGFRKERSCETQLISLIHELTSELDKGGQTDVILLDFAKAFDKVPHKRLLNKLHTVGIDHKTQSWIKAFLSGRTQEVVVGGEKSDRGQVISGVPQGSVLGPTLFLVYINDLPTSIKSNVCLFADDTLLYKHILTEEDCKILDNDLSTLQAWEENWLMKFNATKCQAMSITNKRKPITYDYHLHEQTLEKVDSAKYLGIEISKNMKWNNHIAHITSKANRTSAFIHRNLKGCPTKTQVHCFKTLTRPTLEYASVVWDPHHQKDINALEMTQRRAARRIPNDFSSTTSASGLTKKFGLETLRTRRKRDKVTAIHKMNHNKIAVNFPESVGKASTRTRGHNHRMTLPRARLDAHLHSFFPSAIRLWNNLPPEAVESASLECFKKIISLCVTD